MTAALIAYALAQLADIYTTIRALKNPANREGNPVILALMERLGDGWPFAKLAFTGAIAFWLYQNGYEAGIWIVAAITGVVAVKNYRKI